MTTISMRIPADVVEDLKRIAPLLGFSGYQPLIRAYVGQGLRADLDRLEPPGTVSSLLASLRRHGVRGDVLSGALREAQVGALPARRGSKRSRKAPARPRASAVR
jgi:hypothetical protein